MPFVKLDTQLLDSTLWMEITQRDIFITALLMAVPWDFDVPQKQIEVRTLNYTGFVVPPGWYGFVRSAGIGIINRAHIDPVAGYPALEALGSPDPESRSHSHGGRRLVRVDGGYIVLNYMVFRERDENGARRSKLYRERKKGRERHGVTSVTSRVIVTEAEAYKEDAAVTCDEEREERAAVASLRVVVAAGSPDGVPLAAGDSSPAPDFKLEAEPVHLRNDRQVKSRGKERGKKAAALVVADDRGPVLMEFPCASGKKKRPKLWPLHKEHLDRWHFAFPDVDLELEMRKAFNWLTVHPKKTFDGMEAFFHNWLTRAQNEPKGKSNGAVSPTFRPKSAGNSAIVEEYLRERQQQHGGQNKPRPAGDKRKP